MYNFLRTSSKSTFLFIYIFSAYEVYFPMSAVKMNLPINEKSESIFSKIPLGRFQVLAAVNNSAAPDYIYSMETNSLLYINNETAEIFMRSGYHSLSEKTKFLITAIPKSRAMGNKMAHMSLEINPQTQDEYCQNLENICFWTEAHYTILEDANKSMEEFLPVLVGLLNPLAAQYLCVNWQLRYTLENGSDYFALKNNLIYTKIPLDHESLNVTETSNLTVVVICMVKTQPDVVTEFQKMLNITIVDRNDNGPELQYNKTYHYNLEDPHFRMNEIIGDKIIFIDKDSVETNSHQTYKIYNDTNEIVRPVCNVYETDHTGKRHSIISCQLVFARNGILSESPYCFVLEANDKTIDSNTSTSAQANICLHTDTEKIHETDRPKALALRTRQNRKTTNIINSDESILYSDSNSYSRNILHTIYCSYPKDVYVQRTATSYYRVTQPDEFMDLLRLKRLRFAIAEDRSGAFGITPIGGIIYVKNTTSLQTAQEEVYFLNITWQDAHQRSFVINVHLLQIQSKGAVCEHKVKSRSQTCAQIKYQTQCVKFCGLATNGEGCVWRGSNGGFFGRNFASCVPNVTFCPDNICDPLETMNTFICPQDCTPGNKIMGPHSTNENKLGILSASGTCICEDNGKCSCAPLDDEPKLKRKRKNETKTELLEKLKSDKSTSNYENADEQNINLGGFVCGKSCLIISITCPLVFIVLIICLIISRRNLLRKTLGKETLATQKGTAGLGGDCDVRNGDLPLMELENGFTFESNDTIWEFDREKLVLDTVLGEGEFGKVVKAYATDIAGIIGITTVAVKMLKTGANSVEYMALLSEFQLLQEVSHPNVIKLLGACTKGESPMIIIEYARYGSLRGYLRLSRKIESAGVDFTDGVEPVTVKNILSFAWQICKGMAYLTEIKLVHRDLAARNILLADGKICKISDFGLTRDVYEDDAYLKRSRDRVPVKWMAPESLADHVYTTKSDVWAFGVSCWELITLGASPYPGIPPQNLYHLLKSGYRMEKPENCSEEVYTIVRTCWTDDPNSRPSFKYLASQFEKLLGNNAKYIELETNAVSNPLYCSDETKLSNMAETDLTKLTNNLGEPDCLDHLWCSPKISYDLPDGSNSREFSTNLSAEFQPPPGYDMPRPLIETATTEQVLRYENDLRFPLNIRKSVCANSIGSNSQNYDSKCGTEHYSVPVKRGRSYMDMTNKTLIPDNLNSDDFEKHIAKTISFRFSSLLNLKEQEDVI
ncbi:uncharacterized protein LOC119688332 [Teleopsis dalmanni]|uniref:uncharacterized protein LOC119688332 n=1 Tax=Teleopsis dalmanni TaxID=139649 RepID=UPI0018CE2352|nr:uncharacterized protein LOC119688332 [Teleopsis dalmanni]